MIALKISETKANSKNALLNYLKLMIYLMKYITIFQQFWKIEKYQNNNKITNQEHILLAFEQLFQVSSSLNTNANSIKIILKFILLYESKFIRRIWTDFLLYLNVDFHYHLLVFV